MLSSEDIKKLSRKTKKLKINTNDTYLVRDKVYVVSSVDIDGDRVLLATTNDYIRDFGWIKRIELRELGFVKCPLLLEEPARQIFELETRLSFLSQSHLERYRKENLRNFERFRLDDLLSDVEEVRTWDIPEEQANALPSANLRGLSFELPVPFYVLTKKEARHRYTRQSERFRDAYNVAMLYGNWPVVWVPPRHGAADLT